MGLFDVFKKKPEHKVNIIDGMYADSYTDTETIKIIKSRYKEQWIKEVTPSSNPELFDPLNPPAQWRYDPFYEVWIKLNE